jgi:hypothetical protein
MVAEAACIPDPQAVWVRSMMTEAKIHALVVSVRNMVPTLTSR